MAKRLTHYKSKESFRKANAYRHIRGIKSKTRNVYIAGKLHKVSGANKK